MRTFLLFVTAFQLLKAGLAECLQETIMFKRGYSEFEGVQVIILSEKSNFSQSVL